MPRVASLVCLLASAVSLLAAEHSQEISDIVAASVVSKPKMIEVLRKNPQKGTLGEAWRLDWFASTQELDRLRVPTAEQEWTIYALTFSKNVEVDMDIFRNYFYLRCKRKERGLSSIPLDRFRKHLWFAAGTPSQTARSSKHVKKNAWKANRRLDAECLPRPVLNQPMQPTARAYVSFLC